MAKLTATEVSRNFAAVLNRVAAGEEIEITRNGSTVAVLRSSAGGFGWMSLQVGV